MVQMCLYDPDGRVMAQVWVPVPNPQYVTFNGTLYSWIAGTQRYEKFVPPFRGGKPMEIDPKPIEVKEKP